VALLGPPNAGKSTLLNRLLGEKLAIVTAKPQTTRSRILGIRNLPGAQLLFVDTPGLHDSPKVLNAALNEAVGEAVKDCDVALLLVDLTQGWRPAHDSLWQELANREVPTVVVGTKCDLPTRGAGAWPPVGAPADCCSVRASGKTGEGVDRLISLVLERLPESPPLYGEDELTDRPLRWLAGELVREAVFEVLEQELPYSIAVEVVRFDETRSDLVTIHADILVERSSQKRIVVGSGGAVVKRIGIRARKQIEKLVGCRVHLQLFIKVDPKWLKSAKRIERLGYY